MTWLRPDDHAFADGPVFTPPAGLRAARAATRNWRDARLLLAVWQQFSASAQIEEGVRLGLTARLINMATTDRVIIRSDAAVRGTLRNEPGGRIEIGGRVYIGDGTILSAAEEIVIGAATLLAHGVQIFDNDSHPIDAKEREEHFRMILGLAPPGPLNIGKAPVRIGERCWIGLNSIVMKGVTIGTDSIIASGSIVVNDIPSGVIAAGNPARVLKEL